MSERRTWTLAGAREMLAEVRRRTADAVAEIEPWLEQRAAAVPASDEWQRLEERIRQRIERWAREMEALGVEVKGPWLVDFDNGAGGYYCWRWPEESLDFFHTYEEGFAGRCRIQ